MLIYVHPLGWSALSPGKEEFTSAHSLPCLSFSEPSPALCKGKHSEHLIACILLSYSLQKERKRPSLPAQLSQYQHHSPEQPCLRHCPCPITRLPLQGLGIGVQRPFMHPRSLKLASTTHSNALYPSFLIFASHWESSVL